MVAGLDAVAVRRVAVFTPYLEELTASGTDNPGYVFRAQRIHSLYHPGARSAGAR
jgi:hypothetical protein